MKVFIVALGTTGDCELFLSLAVALKKNGHDVLLGVPASFAHKVVENDVSVTVIGGENVPTQQEIIGSFTEISDLRKRTYAFYTNWLLPQLPLVRTHIVSKAVGFDYFISNLKMAINKNGVTMPGAFVTYDLPEDLELMRKYGGRAYNGRVLDLVALPQYLADPNGVWGAEYCFTGFWEAVVAKSWSPSEGLSRFIADGPPPVVLTMGSMQPCVPKELERFFMYALEQEGQRGIWISSSQGEPPDASMTRIWAEQYIPYSWLFRQASCIIHHGGIGTVEAAIRAGAPSIIVPQISCQEKIGKLMVDQGHAVDIIPPGCLSRDRLARGIQVALSDKGQLSGLAPSRWRGEHEGQGTAMAVKCIEAHWQRLFG